MILSVGAASSDVHLKPFWFVYFMHISRSLQREISVLS